VILENLEALTELYPLNRQCFCLFNRNWANNYKNVDIYFERNFGSL